MMCRPAFAQLLFAALAVSSFILADASGLLARRAGGANDLNTHKEQIDGAQRVARALLQGLPPARPPLPPGADG